MSSSPPTPAPKPNSTLTTNFMSPPSPSALEGNTNSADSKMAGMLASPPPLATTSTNGSSPVGSPDDELAPGALAGLIVGVVLGAIIVLICVCIFICFHRRRKRKLAERIRGGRQKGTVFCMHPFPTLGMSLNARLLFPVFGSMYASLSSRKSLLSAAAGSGYGFSQNTFSLEELSAATNGFSEANLLGQGGFGYVHKGVLSDGKVVAIKQLKAGSGQGEREFRAEIEIISRVHHRHLVSLVGYCITGAQRMLVYEFVPNNTLEFHLHGDDRPTMDWSTRMTIATGSAKGLAYLHEDCHPKIIHRDIKAANILLDYSFEAKVADFGLAKYSLDTETHVSTRIMGTFGYLAPEYASTGKLTDRSDVFSFGVVLLELITGKRPVDRKSFHNGSIVDWARPLLKQALEDGNCCALVDKNLQYYDSVEMNRMIFCAAACVRHSARLRPSLSQIVRALQGNMPLDNLSAGTLPGQSIGFSSNGSSDYSSSQYGEDLKKFKKIVLESPECGRNEYNGPTSGLGQKPSRSSTEGGQTAEEEDLGVDNNFRDSHQRS
ncbi:hypothetical protein K2173_004292 [Erythroxylum novogranatense]|uniref:non-specific serine/threonine protein kinase n=1 Tax=Erythroxylum novogranatense TaxID=1862640 RepID=A0AAV8U2F2_9ROSI|nr:hypothetical protein K2173_004292 [Erythroxylum novogranatense]